MAHVPQFKGPFQISAYGEDLGKPTIFRHTDGSMIIAAAAEDGDSEPVLHVLMTIRAKRGEAWRTTDPDQEAFAAHVVAVLNANPFKEA